MNYRVIINGCLNNIEKGNDIKDNVLCVVNALKETTKIADGTLRHLKNRQNSGFLLERLNYEDLKKVGNYRSDHKTKRNKKIIRFKRPEFSIEFFFKRRSISYSENLDNIVDSMERKKERYTEAELQTMILRNVLESKTHKEAILGNSSRSLDNYDIVKVDIIRRRNILGFLPSNQRETVYVT